MRKPLHFAVAVLGTLSLVTAFVVAPAVVVPAAAARPTQRIAGSDRYATAAAVSRAAFPTPPADGTVVLVSGTGWADAATAGALAASLGAPMLYTTASAVPATTLAELKRLAPQHAVVVGGAAAVSAAVETSIAALVPDTTRIDGADSYAVSVAAARAAFPAGAATVYVADGSAYPGLLTAGTLAAAAKAPLVVLNGRAGAPSDAAVQLIADLGATSVVLVGGSGLISGGVAAGLAGEGRTVTRIGADDRYALANAVAAKFTAKSRPLIIAQGTSFASALATTVLSARWGAPVLLTKGLCAETAIRTYVAGHAPSRITTVGPATEVRGVVGQLNTCLSTTDPKSPWVLVNKKHRLSPKSYFPSGLRRVKLPGGYSMRAPAATALEKMSAAAKKAGKGSLGLVSGFRSYSTQIRVYNGHVAGKGKAKADLVSARPGYSEHQTGFTADVVACNPRCGSANAFGSSKAGKWVAANAYKYGFIVRYEKGQTAITGYSSEPWHLRWVGVVLATDYHNGGFHTLEQYLGYPAAPKY